MAVTANLSITSETLNGEQLTFSDATTYGTPARVDVAVIIRAFHVDSSLTETRKEFNAYDPTDATTFVLNVDQTADDIAVIDGAHKVSMFIIDESLYEGVNGSGIHIIDGAAEDTYTDAELDALSESSITNYYLPLPVLFQQYNDIVRVQSDNLIDIGTADFKQEMLDVKVKISGASAQLRMGNISRAATIVESE